MGYYWKLSPEGQREHDEEEVHRVKWEAGEEEREARLAAKKAASKRGFA